MGTPLSSPEHNALEVAVTRGCGCSPDPRTCLPAAIV